MLGKQHLTLSVMSMTPVLIPWLESYPFFVIISLIGVGIGSLIPDVDAKDAAVFHTNIRGLKSTPGLAFNRLLAPSLPLFGYITKYFIYKPAIHLFNLITSYNFQEKHRHLTHSILGIFTVTSVTGLYLMIPLILLEINLVFPLTFLIGYFVGQFLHLIQDSCTKSGVAWRQPFSNTKLKGNLTTGKDNFKPLMLLYLLSGLTLLSAYTTLNKSYANAFKGSLTMVGLLWITFMMVSNVRIKT